MHKDAFHANICQVLSVLWGGSFDLDGCFILPAEIEAGNSLKVDPHKMTLPGLP